MALHITSHGFGRLSAPLPSALWLSAMLLSASGIHAQVAPPAAYPSTMKLNYVREWDARAPIQDSATLVARPVSDVGHTTQYLDGLGRPVQTVLWQVSPAGKDQVTSMVYDPYGREQYSYLPFVSNVAGAGDVDNDGNFKPDAFQQQAAFSAGQYPGESWFYSQVAYEASPLNRVLTTLSAGNNWVGSGRGAANQYLVNTAADSVQIWNIALTPGSLPTDAGTYGDGQLYKNVTTDEQNHQVIQYKDKDGHIVLKKTQLTDGAGSGHSGWLCIYSVYDVIGNLRFVITPRAVDWLMSAGWALSQDIADGLCYRYEYDLRNRLIVKKLPGVAEQWTVYDSRDRQVLSQDGNMRSQGKWLFSKYDGLNRQILSGFYTDSAHNTQQGMQSYLNALNMGLYELPGTNHYLYTFNLSFPVNTMADILWIKYYDDYQWAPNYGEPGILDNSYSSQFLTPSNTVYPYPQPQVALSVVRGQLTGVWDATYPGPLSRFFYDDHGRLLQTKYFNPTTGADVTTTQYDFTGQPVRTYVKQNKGNPNPQTHYIMTKTDYDAVGRLVHIWKNIDSATGDQLISIHHYNELGQLQSKDLGNYLDSMVYDYNIRGWLTGINKNALPGTANHWFGVEIGYDKPSVLGISFGTPQYSGNLAGIIWRSAGDNVNRQYAYTYDDFGRLQTAGYQDNSTGTWGTAGMDYTTQNAYDLNGNITSMDQKGWKIGSPAANIDQLAYTYVPNSDRIKVVTDSANDPNSTLGDFHYNPSSKDTMDYTYDANGNITSDRNKNIMSITYNYLNQPTLFMYNNYNYVGFEYDNFGNKYEKYAVDNNVSPSRTVVTKYMTGGVEYYNDTLELISTEDGRARWAFHQYTNGDSAYGIEYDFFERDHLRNTRVVLTQEKDTAQYIATLEAASRAKEDQLFYGLDSTVVARTSASGYPDDVTVSNPNDSVARVNGNGPRQGPSIILKVMSGDRIDIGVQYYYNSNSNPASPIPLNPADIINVLATGMSTLSSSADAAFSTLSNPGTSPLVGALLSGINNQSGGDPGKPQAFLNWIFLDNQFHYIGNNNQSGALQVGPAGTQTGGQLQSPLAMTGINVSKNGYVYIYVSNTTPGWDVYFDNLSVTHYTGAMLEDNHYYPFGLTMAGISDKALKDRYAVNKFRFTGRELNSREFHDGTGLDLYDMGTRFQDPQLGRFIQPDPLSAKYEHNSPYAYAENKVTQGIDLEGLELLPLNSSWFKEYVDASSTDHYGRMLYKPYVDIVAKNVPDVFKDELDKPLFSAASVNIGPDGVIVTGNENRQMLLPGNRLPRNPEWGLEPDMEYTDGTGGARMAPGDYEDNKAYAEQAKSAGEALQEGYKYYDLFANKIPLWKAYRGLWEQGRAFNTAAHLVGPMAMGLMKTTTEKDRSDLINFITDGSTPSFQLGNKESIQHTVDVMKAGIDIMQANGITIDPSLLQTLDMLNVLVQQQQKRNNARNN
ncbi:MAG TPA: DUF6443 domain-containing protein [Puia sp.]|nr:DUF6443 domain-containing protein [Puia sp.]